MEKNNKNKKGSTTHKKKRKKRKEKRMFADAASQRSHGEIIQDLGQEGLNPMTGILTRRGDTERYMRRRSGTT